MKRIVAVILVSLLVASPVSAGQRLKPLDWEQVTRLKAGTEIMLTIAGGQPTRVLLVFADDSTVVTLKPDTPKLPGSVERALINAGPHWPDILQRGGSSTTDQVRVSKEGVFDGDRKVADLMQTPRGEVAEISQPQHSHLIRNILIGFAVVVTTVLLVLAGTGYLED